jgi:transcriptional regulator with XRE-family HTH domain
MPMGQNKRPMPAKLGRKLKAIRERLELTEEQLIERLDCPSIPLNRGDIDRYEKNLREPPIIVLLRYARLAGVAQADLADDAACLDR